MTRRWSAGEITDLSGTRFRVVQGAKSRDDLRLEWWTPTGWQPIHMAVAAYLVDFFYENEEALRRVRPNWRRSGGEYFLTECVVKAARDGWRAVAQAIARQRVA